MPKAKAKSLPVEQEAEEIAEEMPLHGAINEDKARVQIDTMDVILDNMAWEINENVPGAMENAIKALKQAVGMIVPGTEEADITTVLKAVHDPTCLAIWPHTEEAEEKLEDLMPEEDIPEGKDAISRIEDAESLTDK